MKTKMEYVKRIFFLMALTFFTAFVISSCDKKSDTTNNKPFTVSGAASGAQMVPAVSGSGTATFTGTYDPSSRVMNYTVNWTNLTGAPTSGSFFNGASGANGTSIGSPWTLDNNLTGTGNMTGNITLTSDQATQLTSGNMYYTMGTAANAGGEVRGQLSATR